MVIAARPIAAFVLIALQLLLSGWEPCLAFAGTGSDAVAAQIATDASRAHEHHRNVPAPASEEESSRTEHDGAPCAMMGPCGAVGVHQTIAVYSDPGPGHPMRSAVHVAAPKSAPLSPEPPPPRG